MRSTFARRTFGEGSRTLVRFAANGSGGVSVVHELQRERLDRWLAANFTNWEVDRRVLDVGCGVGSVQRSTEALGLSYFGCDLKFDGTTQFDGRFFSDGACLAARSDSFAAVTCLEVAEHAVDAHGLLREINRVLVPGGVALVSVPFAQPLHEEPADFWRWTEHGLRQVFQESGFSDVVVEPRGSLLALVQHGLAVSTLGVLSRCLLPDWVTHRVGKWTVGLLGRIPAFRKPLRAFPHGYWVTCRKPPPLQIAGRADARDENVGSISSSEPA